MAQSTTMTIRQLRILRAVEEQGGVKAASELLKVAQPAISQQLMLLARELGVPLHKRVRDGIELTPAGHFFAREARAIVSQLDRLKSAITRKPQASAAESLTIGGNFALSVSLLPSLLVQFRKTRPNLKLHLRTCDRFMLEELIVSNQIELAVMYHPPRDRQLTSERCGTEPVVAFAAAHHPLARKREIQPKDLEQVAFVIRDPARHTGAGVKSIELLRRKGMHPNVLMDCDSVGAVKNSVLKNNAVGILFESAVQDDIQRGSFKALKLPVEETIVAHRHAIYHRTRPLSPTGKSFLELLKKTFTK
jgi:DNA-binding transcriptional LysR family regulator